MKQRSDEWFEARKGKFTASEIHRLLGGIDKNGNLTKTTSGAIDNFAIEKAIEELHGLEPQAEFLSKDVERGVELEPQAIECFSQIMAEKFIDVTECSFYTYSQHSGASPDSLVGKTDTLELKCPKRLKFFKYIIFGIDYIELKYMAQMQMQLLATGRVKAYFFNYLVFNGKEYYHTIEVPRDEEMIELIKERIDYAASRKEFFKLKIQSNKQYGMMDFMEEII